MKNNARKLIRAILFAAVIITSISVSGLVAQEEAREGVGTPTPTASTDETSLDGGMATFTSASANGPDVAVLAYCIGLSGSVGAQNTVNTLVADGRFGSVTLIDGDLVQPTAEYLLSEFDCVIAMTDRRCGVPIPPEIADSAADAMTGFVQGGGGVVVSTFGFSILPSGIGFGPSIFGPGLSPLQQATPYYNAAAGYIDISGASTVSPCDELLAGVTAPVSSSYANHVSLSDGATLCVNYMNMRHLLAVNADQTVVGLNTCPTVDNGQASYRRLISNSVYLVCKERVIQVYVDIKPGSCPNPLNKKSQGVLPVAVLGTEDFDVATIDPATIELNRSCKDCEGVSPLRWSYEDVATPFEGVLCDCHELEGDGYMDLTLKFDTQELVEKLDLCPLDGQTIPLNITGNLIEEEGGTPIKGADCIWVLKPGKPDDKPTGKPDDKPTGKPDDKPTGKPDDKPTGKIQDN